MSNNFRINEISDNVFKGNIKALANKTQKQIKEQKEEFEYELEKTISDLDNSERNSLLARLAKDSEKGEYSFFDSNGNINVSKVKSIINVKIKEIQEETRTKTEKSQNDMSDVKNNDAEKLNVSQEAKEKVTQLIDSYSKLSTDEEKREFINNIFGKDKKVTDQEFDAYKTQLDLASFVKKMREEGRSVSEIQKAVDDNPNFEKLTDEQRKISNEGYTLIENQIHLKTDIEILEHKISDLENQLENEDYSEEKKNDIKAEIKRIKEDLKIKRNEEKDIAKKTSITKTERTNEFEKAKTAAIFEEEKATEILKIKREESRLETDFEGVKKLENLKELLTKGIGKNDIDKAIGLFNIALYSLDEGASKDDLQDMIKEMQEGATPETIAVLESLTNIEFDKSIEEILSSDEEKINLIEQLTEELEKIQSIEIEDKTSEEPITDSELKDAFAFLEEEIEVGEVPVPQPEGKELTENVEETKETVVAVSPKVFSLMGIIKKSSSVRSGEIKGQQDITKVLVTGEEEKGKEAVTVGIE